MVSSSSQEPRVRTIGVQVKLLEKKSQDKPSKELVNRVCKCDFLALLRYAVVLLIYFNLIT